MEQPTTPPPAPLTPLGAQTPHAHPALPWVIGGLALLVIITAAWAILQYDIIPDRFFPDRSPEPMATETQTPWVAPQSAEVPMDCAILDAVDATTNESAALSFGQRHAWFAGFQKQIIDGWVVDSVCYNSEANQAVYLKHFAGKQTVLEPEYQLGVYAVATDTFDKGPVFKVPLYGGCAYTEELLPKWEGEWWHGFTISFGCRGGDGGAGLEQYYVFDLNAKTQTMTQECSINGAEPKQCTPTDELIGTGAPWKRLIPENEQFEARIPAAWIVNPVRRTTTTHATLGVSTDTIQLIPDFARGEGPEFFAFDVTDEPVSPETVLTYLHANEIPNGLYGKIRDGMLNGYRVISYEAGGLCNGREAVFFGPRSTLVLTEQCLGADMSYDGIIPTIRFNPEP